jgi:hypothetical protein
MTTATDNRQNVRNLIVSTLSLYGDDERWCRLGPFYSSPLRQQPLGRSGLLNGNNQRRADVKGATIRQVFPALSQRPIGSWGPKKILGSRSAGRKSFSHGVLSQSTCDNPGIGRRTLIGITASRLELRIIGIDKEG